MTVQFHALVVSDHRIQPQTPQLHHSMRRGLNVAKPDWTPFSIHESGYQQALKDWNHSGGDVTCFDNAGVTARTSGGIIDRLSHDHCGSRPHEGREANGIPISKADAASALATADGLWGSRAMQADA